MDQETAPENNFQPQTSLSKRKKLLLFLSILIGLIAAGFLVYFFFIAKKPQNLVNQNSTPSNPSNNQGESQPIVIFDNRSNTKEANFYLITEDSTQLTTLISFPNREQINKDYSELAGPTGVFAISPDGKKFAYVVIEKIDKEQIKNYKNTAFYNDPMYDATYYESVCDSVNNLYMMNLDTKEKHLISSRISYSGNVPFTIEAIFWSKDSKNLIFSNLEISTNVTESLTISEMVKLTSINLDTHKEQEVGIDELQNNQTWVKQAYVGSSLKEEAVFADYLEKECASETEESAYYACAEKTQPKTAPVSGLCHGFTSGNKKWFLILGCDDNLKNKDGSFPIFIYGEGNKKFSEIKDVRYAIGWLYESDKFIVMCNDGYLWIYDTSGKGKKLTDQKFEATSELQ